MEHFYTNNGLGLPSWSLETVTEETDGSLEKPFATTVGFTAGYLGFGLCVLAHGPRQAAGRCVEQAIGFARGTIVSIESDPTE